MQQLKEIIIHRIDKTQHHSPTVHLGPSSLKPSDARVIKFAEVAMEVFTSNEDKHLSVLADFNTDTAVFPFSDWCLSYFQGQTSFVKFTHDSTNRLANNMHQQQLATGGFVVFARVDIDGASALLVVMLHSQEGLSISSKLEFEDVTHLELKHIDKAALISAPANGVFGPKPVKYAGFRKAMSLYFQEFIGPDMFRNPAKDSRQLIDVMQDYATKNQFDAATLDAARISVRNYAQQTASTGGELDLSVLSALIHPQKPTDFGVFAATNGVSAWMWA